MPRISNASLSSPTGRARLIMERFRRGWSQQELADQLGTTPLNVSRWERRLTTPSPYFRQRLVALFGLTESELDLLPDLAPEIPISAGPEIGKEPCSRPCIDSMIPLPTLGLPLVGRLQEMRQLREHLLHSGRSSFLALSGLPGVGKTALAAALAHDQEIRETFADGILWASLGPDAQIMDPFRRWGELLGVSTREARNLASLEEWKQLLRTRLASRRMLLVLDDIWHIEDVATCQLGGPDCSYLLTTRSPLLARQVALTNSFTIKELEEEQSIELLSLLAPEAVHLEPEQIRSLVKLVGGLPLALLLIGTHLRAHGYSGQSRRIRAALHELEQAQRRLELSWLLSPLQTWKAGPLTLVVTISPSECQLSEEARTALWALSAFPAKPGSFTEAEALSVCQQSVEALDALSDAGLLESVGEGRYALHQTIVDYGQFRLAQRC